MSIGLQATCIGLAANELNLPGKSQERACLNQLIELAREDAAGIKYHIGGAKIRFQQVIAAFHGFYPPVTCGYIIQRSFHHILLLVKGKYREILTTCYGARHCRNRCFRE